MEGITILAQKTIDVVIDHTWGFTGISILGIILIAMGILCSTVMICDKDIDGFGLIMCIIAIGLGILTFRLKSVNEKVTEYKVLISDSITFNEFYEKYIIEDKEGEIYTIREKTTVEKGE